jgi:DNA helicase IV
MIRKHLKKTGKPGRLRGVRPLRNRKFQPVIDTHSGNKVRSQYERICADWLQSEGIEFVYEPVILMQGRQFRPDFYLPKYDLFLEICGYNHMPYYRNRVSHKRELYEKFKLKVAFINHDGKGSLIGKIKNVLSSASEK